MKVYVFGNEDFTQDNAAFKIVDLLSKDFKNVEFIKVYPNQDLPFIGEKETLIIDTVIGINQVSQINDSDLDKLILSKSLTVHDFDLGFQIKYLKKIGKLGKVTIIGIPVLSKKQNYLRIQSILRKFVAQDMQGS